MIPIKKITVIMGVFLAFFCINLLFARAGVIRNSVPTISSISPCTANEGILSVKIIGSNFKTVKSVNIISATGIVTECQYIVNSITSITVTVNLSAGTYYFKITTKYGTASSPSLVINALQPPSPTPTTYRLKSTIPDLVNAGTVSEGVSTSGNRVMWRGPDSQIHFLGAFGGDAQLGWFGHYINMNTGAHKLITGPPKGEARHWAYNPSVDRAYTHSGYANPNESFCEFNPTTQTLSIIRNELTTCLNLLIGDDYRVYTATLGNRLYSYDPALGATIGWKDYGIVHADADPGSNYFSLGADDSHVYCGVKHANGTWTLVISPSSGTAQWSEWEFGGAGDIGLSIGLNENHVEHKWTLTRTLYDGSKKYYALSRGGYTELTPGQAGYTWSGTPPNQFLQGEYHFDRAPNYCVAASDESSYPLFASTYNYEVDLTNFFPIKGIHEFTSIKYQTSGSYTWLESTLPYAGPWVPQSITCLALKTSNSIFAVSYGYNASANLDYLSKSTTYLGANIQAPYSALNHPSGDIYVGGYANRVLRYNPGLPWTLNSSNASPRLPGDPTNPNPYFIQMPAPSLHYRHGLAYDANLLIWIGGNTTRQSPDYGNVMWYNPADGSTGYLFPEWATTGTMFRSLCTANNGERICVSDNIGNIWIINATTKMVDPDPIIPLAASKTYMIEVENDIVFGIVFAPGPTYKVIRFKPSTKEILTLQDLGVSGTPFGFGDNQYSRMNYKLEKGPDGYVWMFVGNSLYRVDPTTCVFTKIIDTNFAKISFAKNNVDLLLYNIDGTTDFKYIPGILEAVSVVSMKHRILNISRSSFYKEDDK